MSRLFTLASALLMGACAVLPAGFSPACAEDTPAVSNVIGVSQEQFIQSLISQDGFDEAWLRAVFASVHERLEIIDILERPSTSRPWYVFRPGFVNPVRIRAGVLFWREHADLIEAISRHYHVDPEYMVTILGVETMWGKQAGRYRVMDVLTTLAFNYPRRADFFRKELREFLLLAREERRDPLSFLGSYAGAMGAPQFMPSSVRAYAQSWGTDNWRNVWDNTADILASVANYLAVHGWQQGAPVVIPAKVDGDGWKTLAEDKFNLHYRVSDLAKFNVVPDAPLQGDPQAVLAPLEREPGTFDYWLGLNNFYVITRYNRSTLYAKAVQELAVAIRAAWEDPNLLPPEPAGKHTGKSAAKGKPVKHTPAKRRVAHR
ncbi:lytic murein transglycosylase B [Burkholderiaceae bacterium DAT-1]|nr:lytic murein transglycosylase B [Burkholderiaceae bacterium DAT-1]